MMQVVIVKIVRPDEPAAFIRTLVADENERDSFVQLLQSNASEGATAEPQRGRTKGKSMEAFRLRRKPAARKARLIAL